jgi:hypothetical protein
MRGGNTCGMRIRTCDTTLLYELRAHFERSGFAVERTDDDDLDVRRPDAPSVEQEAREIELHLKVWRLLHPTLQVELVDPVDASS